MEFRGSRAFYERCIEPILCDASEGASGTSGLAVAAPALDPPPYQPDSPVRFNRFVGQVGARAAEPDQRLMAFAFYLWNFERKDEFRGRDIAAFFRTVQDEPPEDLDERLNDLAERRRFLAAGTVPGTWRLTNKGVNYVKNRLLAPT